MDPVEVKAAINAGRLELYIQVDYQQVMHIMLRDVETGEVVKIGEVKINE